MANEQEKKTQDLKCLIRPCHVYKDELDECKSIRGRFHQLFIFGEQVDCSQWETDYKNCKLWEKNEDNGAYNALVESQQKRIRDRFTAHYQNDVWERRKEPPDDWNRPLAEHLVTRMEKSNLRYYKEELQKTENHEIASSRSSCTIL